MVLRIQIQIRDAIDHRPVTRAYNRAERQVLLTAARRGRLIAQRSMRPAGKRGKPSQPGEPPRKRLGQLRRFLLYAYEPARHVAIFGPKKLAGARQNTPEALERGGTFRRRVGWRKKRRLAQVRYEKRPAMVPALDKISPDLPAMWKNSIR